MPKSTDRKWLKGRDKYVSGFCNDHGKMAQCEGTKPKSFRGTPMPTCPFWSTCPCECHKRVDEIYEMTGVERQEMSNPEYIPVRSEFVIPEVPIPSLANVASSNGGPIATPTVEHDAPANVTPLTTRRTALGYAVKGTLEAQVWDAVQKLDNPITTAKVSDFITSNYRVPTQSRGAIQAVWVRWEGLGFATMGKKPVRFVSFTGEGTWQELERMKASVKRQKKKEQSDFRRGVR